MPRPITWFFRDIFPVCVEESRPLIPVSLLLRVVSGLQRSRCWLHEYDFCLFVILWMPHVLKCFRLIIDPFAFHCPVVVQYVFLPEKGYQKIHAGQNAVSRQPCGIFIPKFPNLCGLLCAATVLEFFRHIFCFLLCKLWLFKYSLHFVFQGDFLAKKIIRRS